MHRVKPVGLRAAVPQESPSGLWLLRAHPRWPPCAQKLPAVQQRPLLLRTVPKSSPAALLVLRPSACPRARISRLAGALPGVVASRLTSHSSRSRFAARLNSGVRLQRRRSWRPDRKSRSSLGLCRHDVALPGNFQVSRHLLQKRCDAGAAKRALRRQRYTAFPLDAESWFPG